MKALAEIEVDIENVRAAWRHYLGQRDASQMGPFVNGVWFVYWIRGWHQPGAELLAEAVEALGSQENEDALVLKARAMGFEAHLAAYLNRSDQGYRLARGSVAILEQLDHPEALLFACLCLSVNAYFLGRYTELSEAADRMIQIATEIDDQWLLVFSLFAASLTAVVKEDYLEARRLAESSLNNSEEIGDVIGAALPLIVLGHVAWVGGRREEARRLYLRCLEISEEVGFYYGIQTSTKYLGKASLSIGEYSEAEGYLRYCLKITSEIGFVRDVINLMCEFARLHRAYGNSEGAVELSAFVLQHPESGSVRMLEGPIRESARSLLAELEDELPQEVYAMALERGRGLNMDETVADLLGTGDHE